MRRFILILFFGFCYGQNISNLRFPKEFMFGVATSAYQIEGGWDVDGKSPSVWDYALHSNPNLTTDGQNGDSACDSYHKYEEDVKLLVAMGVQHYRFSISWPRILPDGIATTINEDGINYYKNLIKALKQNNIEPMVTIFHWDLPQVLQESGGFLNESIVDWFADYASILFEYFGDDVKYWATFNEPSVFCPLGYELGVFPPLIELSGIGEYQCAYHVLKAHAKVWHIYDEQYRAKQGGNVSIVLNTAAYLPATDSDENRTAAETQQQFDVGLYAHPIFLGDFPPVVKTRVAARSTEEGRSQSRLPEFTAEEIDYIKGTADYFGLNVYSAAYVYNTDSPVVDPPSSRADSGVGTFQPDEWQDTQTYIRSVPATMQQLLVWIKDQYNSPIIIVTENGYATSGNLNDNERIIYITGYLSSIRKAMAEDKVNVAAYTVWSLMDNFEWLSGYTRNFGLYEVDFNSEDKERRRRVSAFMYTGIIESRCLTVSCVDE